MTKDNTPEKRAEDFPGRGRTTSSAAATQAIDLEVVRAAMHTVGHGEHGSLLHNPGLITPDDNVTPVPSEAGPDHEGEPREEDDQDPGTPPQAPEEDTTHMDDVSSASEGELPGHGPSAEHNIHCPSGAGIAMVGAALALLVGCTYANYGSH